MKTVVPVCFAVALGLALLPLTTTAQSRHADGKNKPRPKGAPSAVADYVARAWEVPSGDFSVNQRKDQDGVLVYRVTLRPDKSIAPPPFRVLDVHVAPGTTDVIGERQVR